MVHEFPIVGVASSAGDLEAIFELLSGLPAGYDGALVIVQHAGSTKRDQSTVQAIATKTDLPVSEAYDGVVMKRSHVYVSGANAGLTIIDDHIGVSVGAAASTHPADRLFASLAESRGSAAIGVVLSGGGSDGALGIQAIKQSGGATFAQYPGSARFSSMPICAIETRCVDSVLRPSEIARELTQHSLV
jgi:two-component system CheB/CheR fusion protein